VRYCIFYSFNSDFCSADYKIPKRLVGGFEVDLLSGVYCIR